MRLASFEQRWVGTIGATLLPPEALGGLRAEQDLGAAVADEVAQSLPATALVLRLGVWMVWLAPLLRAGRPRTFGGLAPAEREALLEELLESERYVVRELLMVLKLFVCLRALGERAVLAQIGAYDLGTGPRRSDEGRLVELSRPLGSLERAS